MPLTPDEKIMRTYSDIEQMAAQDYSIGLVAHYKPLAELINQRKFKTVIEIGTAYAGNAFHLLSNTEIESLICVDPYRFYAAMPGFINQEEYDTLYQYAKDRLSSFKNVEILRLTSKESFKIIKPSDLIFLDGSHEYEDVKWECDNYSKLLKPGGVLSGHDWNIFEGVNKAVNEFASYANKQINILQGNIWFINY